MTDECYGTGFALSGGFVKGYAHLGALQALFEYGIRPEIIAGVSIGAVAGVFIADGKRPEEVLELFMSREFRSFTGFTLSLIHISTLPSQEDKQTRFPPEDGDRKRPQGSRSTPCQRP